MTVDSCRSVFIWGRLIPLPSTNLSTPSMFLTKVGTTAIYTGGSLIRIFWRKHKTCRAKMSRGLEIICLNFIELNKFPWVDMQFAHRDIIDQTLAELSLSLLTLNLHSNFAPAFTFHVLFVNLHLTFTFKLLYNLLAQTLSQYLIRH